ncbi:hypothetical protein ACOSP7_026281 [Xanthoceras sorbifolium]
MHEQHAAMHEKQHINTQATAERAYFLHEKIANNVAPASSSMNFTRTEATNSDVSKQSALTMLAVQARGKRMTDDYASDLRFTAG